MRLPARLTAPPLARFTDPSFASIALLAALVLAPVTANAQQLSTPSVDTVPHAIVRVRNTGPSRWIGHTGWTLVPERTIAPDPNSTAILAEPLDLAVDARGDIFESDWKIDGIQEFDSTGRFVRQIGRKGNGPGEFESPVEMTIRHDTLLLYASNQARVSLRRANGDLIREWQVGFCCGSTPRFGPGNTVMVLAQVRQASVLRSAVVRWQMDGTMIDTLLLPPEPEQRSWHNAHGVFPIPFTAYAVGTFNSRGWYISGFPDKYALTISHRGADTASIIQLPGMRVRTDGAFVDSVFARYAKLPRLADIAKRGDIPADQPFFIDLFADEHDNIWIERPDSRGKSGSFDVINPDGNFLGSVAIPDPALRSLLFVNNRLYGIGEDDDGNPVIRVYRIDRRGR